MKPYQFKLFEKLLDECNPTSIGEIGTHHGRTSEQMCNYILTTTSNNLSFTGYDAYDIVADDILFAVKEKNGKGHGDYHNAFKRLNNLKTHHSPRFNFELVKGFTNVTLTSPISFDFVYVDAGHTYESVKHDWNMVKNSKLVVFDDYGMPGVNQLMKEIEETGMIVEYTQNTDESRAVAIIRNF
jgi:hypothetical protein